MKEGNRKKELMKKEKSIFDERKQKMGCTNEGVDET